MRHLRTFWEPKGSMLRLIIVKMPFRMPVVLLCAATLAGCATDGAHPSGTTTTKGPSTATGPLPTARTGESLLVVQTFVGAVQHTSPADVLRTSGLAPAKCTAWNLAPSSRGGGSYEVHLVVPSDAASVLRTALLRLDGVGAVAEADLGEFGRVQADARDAKRIPC
jgi:hypothetical protein